MTHVVYSASRQTLAGYALANRHQNRVDTFVHTAYDQLREDDAMLSVKRAVCDPVLV